VVALTLLVVGTAVTGRLRGFPGPGVATIGWHLTAAVVAVLAQWRADRGAGLRALAAGGLVVATAGLVLWSQWWR
jgi:hypothetical protein